MGNSYSARGRATDGATNSPCPGTELAGEGSGAAGFFARCGGAASAARQPRASKAQMAPTRTRSRIWINVLPAFLAQAHPASAPLPVPHCTRDVADKAPRKIALRHRLLRLLPDTALNAAGNAAPHSRSDHSPGMSIADIFLLR